METYLLEEAMKDPIAFLTTTSNAEDTLYYNQAMQASDKKEFRVAMEKEIQDHEERDHWKVVPKTNVPLGTRILQSVWSF